VVRGRSNSLAAAIINDVDERLPWVPASGAGVCVSCVRACVYGPCERPHTLLQRL
jgi:hypothetical protein